MPRSRSMSIRSRYWARIARASTTPVSCSIRSARVDLPWSMWAMMQKLRIIAGSVRPGLGAGGVKSSSRSAARRSCSRAAVGPARRAVTPGAPSSHAGPPHPIARGSPDVVKPVATRTRRRDDGPVPADVPETYARGVRLPYRSLPGAVQAWVEEQLGGPVVAVEDRVGGFSPGCAAVVGTAERSVFVKAVGSVPNPSSLALYRRERSRLAALPDHPALAPGAGRGRPRPARPGVGGTCCCRRCPASRRRTRGPSRWPGSSSTGWATLQETLVAAAGSPALAALPASDDLVRFFRPWSEVLDDPADPWHDDPWVRYRACRAAGGAGRTCAEAAGRRGARARRPAGRQRARRPAGLAGR